MNVTVRQLRAFVFVTQLKSFTKAAERLHLTQSALSLLIRQLEENLQVQLIERSTRKVELTAAGLELMSSAERLLDDLDATLANVADLGAKQRGKVVIAAPYILATTFLVEVIAEFKTRFPTIAVHLKDSLPEQVLMQVRSGGADLGVGSFREWEPGLQWKPLFQEPLVAVYPRGHPIGELAQLNWRDLIGLPVISLNRDSIFRDLTEDGFSQAGHSLAPAYEVAYAGTALALVRVGLGVAILPECVEVLTDPSIGVRPLQNPQILRSVAVITRDGRSLSPAAEAFVDMLRESAKVPASLAVPPPSTPPSRKANEPRTKPPAREHHGAKPAGQKR
ncbi:LysR family transcriptional regulator [Bradyrhizobium jicamae]|uniref:LysR family transcriptional regulator n=1 Tax=Bradyrhizobium jicamae TaxID=280332 RepID=UPI001BA7E4D1|nr:LysR family transcriptional regulator [Bradyrhizobium jicamae]MBR0751237.1 LysR family transcriptional regulator [Bradyrhizobium jicamae]